MLNEDGITVSDIPGQAPVKFTGAQIVRVQAGEQRLPFPPRIMVGFGVDGHFECGNISIQADEDRRPACWALFFTGLSAGTSAPDVAVRACAKYHQ